MLLGLPAAVGGHLTSVTDAGTASASGRRASARLWMRHAAEAVELAVIRRRVRRWTEQNDVPEAAVIDLQLALGEAVSNGVDHAYRKGESGTVDVELELRDNGNVAVRVLDHGRWRPAPLQPGHRGRGLTIIEALSEGMRISRTDDGTQICFDIPAGG